MGKAEKCPNGWPKISGFVKHYRTDEAGNLIDGTTGEVIGPAPSDWTRWESATAWGYWYLPSDRHTD